MKKRITRKPYHTRRHTPMSSETLYLHLCACLFLFLMITFRFSCAGLGRGTPGSSYKSGQRDDQSHLATRTKHDKSSHKRTGEQCEVHFHGLTFRAATICAFNGGG